MMTLFSQVKLAPRDPILGLNEAFNADPRSNKTNLGVGVYFTDAGKIPILRAVQAAEKLRAEKPTPRGYLPIDGLPAYNQGAQALIFGEKSPLIADGRIVTVQTLGGTGALRIGADFLRQIKPNSQVIISDPSWENHRALFKAVGFEVGAYRYYDANTYSLDFGGMLKALATHPARTIVVLHACCHNPTGVDLTAAQWAEVVNVCRSSNLIPFLDMAYQGFADGLEMDSTAVRLFAESEMPFLVASSFSKSFSLYGERVGALSVVTQNQDEAARVLSQLKTIIRTNYSNPPTHGASVVAAVLNTPDLRSMWEQELGEMRDRIKLMRQSFVEKLARDVPQQNFSFVNAQRGMFSYSGLTASQVEKLQQDFGIYVVSTGRICVAALNSGNIDHVTQSIANVVSAS